MSKVEDLRNAFPHLQERLYINNAATAPLSTPVVEAMDVFLKERHTGGIENFEQLSVRMEEARRRSARLLGCDPARVEFVSNTSTALHFLAEGIAWKKGDRVAVPSCEFPANVYPFMHLKRKGVTVDFIPHEESTFSLEDVDKVLQPSTRLLSMSWVQFLSGFRANLTSIGELCRKRDLIFSVDAIQGLGALSLDVESAGVDFLASGGHKWLMAPQGTGLLYCSERLQEMLTPPAGWLHGPVDWERFFNYELRHHDDARRFRLGTYNGVGIAGLNASLGLLDEFGFDWWEERVIRLARFLAEKLHESGYKLYGGGRDRQASGIVTISHPRAEALYTSMKEGSMVAALRNGLLRFSPNAYNTTEEMERVVDAIQSFKAR